MKQSKRGRLNELDYHKIGTGLIIALSGAALTYLSEVIVQIDFGVYTALVVAVWSVLVNAVRKLWQGR